VPLTLTTRQVGDVTVTTCSGRIVDGPEASRLQQHFESLLPHASCIVLNLADVSFVDSSGLGLLVRYVVRARAAYGDLKLCALTPQMTEVLRVSRLTRIFDVQAGDEEAVGAFYRPNRPAASFARLETEILCVDPSLNVLAYAAELFRQAGYGVMTANNLPDALILLRATRPRLVVINAAFHARHDTRTAESFQQLADAIGVVELPDDFSTHDAGDAAGGLLESVQARLGGARVAGI